MYVLCFIQRLRSTMFCVLLAVEAALLEIILKQYYRSERVINHQADKSSGHCWRVMSVFVTFNAFGLLVRQVDNQYTENPARLQERGFYKRQEFCFISSNVHFSDRKLTGTCNVTFINELLTINIYILNVVSECGSNKWEKVVCGT